MLTPPDAPPPATLAPDLLTQVAVVPGGVIEATAAPGALFAPAPLPANAALIGRSVEGRALVAHSFGVGEQVLLLVGGMHGGYEANTVELANQLIAHFSTTPTDVLPGLRLMIVPVANPDGLARGRTTEGRFNGAGVDLNRNWGCDWSPEAVWRQERVNAGTRAFSEPESQALAALVQTLNPRVALFYHSAANGIYVGDCGSSESGAMAVVLGEATGYSYGQAWSAYPVTGTAASWASSLGVAAADVELANWTDTDFERNLRGIMALQAWLLAES